MIERVFGRVRFAVEHRRADGDGGATLRVFESGGEGRELLRFDCFERSPHWHLAPRGRDELTRLDPAADPVDFALGELGRDFDGLLARAGLAPGAPSDAAALAAALGEIEPALRNPEPDFDGVDLGRLRLRRGEKWGLYGDDVIAAWVADMDLPHAEPVRLALARALASGDLGYPVNPRPGDLPALFAERAAERWGWRPEPRLVEVMTDVVQGLYIGLLTYAGEGDGVVIQTPIYPPFLVAVRETARRLVECPLEPGAERYEIDFDRLRAAVDERTRVFMLCNPHNPTGRAFTRAELEGIAELALERDLVVLSDEIHADLVLPGAEHLPLASLGPEIERRTVTLNSASKAFNVAGLRCAVAAFGSEELKRRFLTLPRHVRGGVGSLGLLATEAAWRHSGPWLERAIAYLDGNRRRVAEFAAESLPGVRHFPPEATYLAWLDFRALELPGGPYRFFLERAKVALSGGAAFGRPGEGFARLNFATSRAILNEALERMAKALEAHGRA